MCVKKIRLSDDQMIADDAGTDQKMAPLPNDKSLVFAIWIRANGISVIQGLVGAIALPSIMVQSNTVIDPGPAIWESLGIRSELGISRKWQNKFAEFYGPPHPDLNLIGLADVAGFEVFKDRGTSNRSILDETQLTDTNFGQWLRRENPVVQATETPSLRVVVGDQIVQNDRLHPPAARQEVAISKTLLSECFRVPTVAAEQLGHEVAHLAEYPPMPDSSPSVRCYSIVSGAGSWLWSHDASNGKTCAFVVLRGSRALRADDRVRLRKTLEILEKFSGLPGIIPFVVLGLMLDYARPVVYCNEYDTVYDQVQIGRGLTQVTRMEMFEQLHHRVNAVTDALKHADNVLSMSRWESLSTLQRPQNISDDAWDQLQQHHHSLQQAIQFRREELTCLTAHVRHLKDRSAALLSTTMGLMSFNDSKVMLEIAEATKKDSTSMKILALMTIIFLPSTALSAIMAIPDMFDFSGDARSLVNSRFWIFFAVALPLTLLTMTCTWCWLRWETLGRRMWPKRRQEGFYAGDEKVV